VQVFVSPPFVAEIVTASPFAPAGKVNDGVVSFVRLSESDFPVSELGSKSALDGVAGATLSTVIDNDPDAEPALPAASVMEAETVHVPSDNVGREQPAAAPTV
jgi:hypothetical protein